MSTPIKLNAILSLPEDFNQDLQPNNSYTIKKGGSRFMPIERPMELTTHNHKYLGKINVKKLIVTQDSTEVTFEVLKLFDEHESKIFSDNFIKPEK